MRGSLRLHIFGSLVALPILVAVVITYLAVGMFHEDKELYVSDLSAQSVELVARNLATRLESLRVKAIHAEGTPAPFLAIKRGQGKPGAPSYTVERAGPGRLRVRVRARGQSQDQLTLEIPPEALLDLRGYAGPTVLSVVNRQGQVLVHPDPALLKAGHKVTGLLRQLHPFKQRGARAGTREVNYRGRPTLAAFATVGRDLAVLETMDKAQVSAAARPLVTSAIVASAIVVLIAIVVALLLGRSIIRPIGLMTRMADAIAQGKFGLAVRTQSAAELSRLMQSFNSMSSALKRREEELLEMQHQLLQAERLNASGRMISAIVKELSEPLDTMFQLASQSRHRLPESSTLRQVQKKIMDEANRAANILQNLARLSGHEEGGGTGEAAEPDIVISDVLVSSRPLFEKNQLRVTTELDTQVGRVALGAEQLRNALLDIFLYVSGHARPEQPVQVSLSRNESAVTLDISYAGAPLSDEERGSLLQPAAGAKGSLELAVASMTLEERGGRLSLEPREGGNRIVASLPAA